jgi:thymidine kinase
MGTLTVVTGPMFSGKTETLLRLTNVSTHQAQLFKHSIDTRYSFTQIVSHSKLSAPAIPVPSITSLLEQVDTEAHIIGIDEGQFFDEGILHACNMLTASGIDVIVAGLDLDFRGRPFSPIPELLALAERVIKLQGRCAICGAPATRSQRLISGEPAPYDSPIQFVGGVSTYEPRCRAHHYVPGHPIERLMIKYGLAYR